MTSIVFRDTRPNLCCLKITYDFQVNSTKPMPGLWRRFWYWALLGWKWEAL